jgi:hypothetical protein
MSDIPENVELSIYWIRLTIDLEEEMVVLSILKIIAAVALPDV